MRSLAIVNLIVHEQSYQIGTKQSTCVLYAYKLAFLALSTCVKIMAFSLKNKARKTYLHVYRDDKGKDKRMITMHINGTW